MNLNAWPLEGSGAHTESLLFLDVTFQLQIEAGHVEIIRNVRAFASHPQTLGQGHG